MIYVLRKLKKKLLSSERFRTLFSFHRIEKSKLAHGRLNRYDNKEYKAKRRKLRKDLNIGEKVLVLAEGIRKKSAPGKFNKQSVQNIFYFNKEKTVSIRKKQKIDQITYYWLKSLQDKRNLAKRLQRINNNFTMHILNFVM